MIKKTLLVTFAVLICCGTTLAAERLSVSDYGLKPDTRENAIPYLKKLLEDCNGKTDVTIVFPKGRYDFYPQYNDVANYYESNTYDVMPKYLAILLKDMQGVTLDGDNSELIMHGRIQPITVDNSQGVTIKNLSIDWDIPLTAQGEVVASGADYFDLRIADESPYLIEDGRLVFVGEGFKSALSAMIEFRGSTRYTEPYVADSPLTFGTIQSDLSKGVVRFTAKEGSKLRMPPVGNLFVLRHNSRDHAGIFVCDSKDVTFDNVHVYHTGGLGILSQYTENITLRNSSVDQNKAKGRILSGHDDGFHFMGCKGEILVDSCRWEGLMDDPINIHGTCVRIIEVISPTKMVCQFMHDMSEGMVWGQVGNTVGFIENRSMNTVATGTMTSFKALDTKRFEVEFAEAIPSAIKAGAALENLTWVPNVTIRNSYFGPCRARGLLLSTPGKIVVENNVFASSGSAILIAGDANQWYESGACKDVLIKGNVFLYPCNSSIYQFCQAIISIEPEIPEPDPKLPFHRNIRIEDNEFNPFDAPILYAKSVDGLTFKGNKIVRSYEYEPYHYRKEAITLDACKGVVISDNTTSDDLLNKEVILENMSPKEVKIGKGETFKLKK